MKKSKRAAQAVRKYTHKKKRVPASASGGLRSSIRARGNSRRRTISKRAKKSSRASIWSFRIILPFAKRLKQHWNHWTALASNRKTSHARAGPRSQSKIKRNVRSTSPPLMHSEKKSLKKVKRRFHKFSNDQLRKWRKIFRARRPAHRRVRVVRGILIRLGRQYAQWTRFPDHKLERDLIQWLDSTRERQKALLNLAKFPEHKVPSHLKKAFEQGPGPRSLKKASRNRKKLALSKWTAFPDHIVQKECVLWLQPSKNVPSHRSQSKPKSFFLSWFYYPEHKAPKELQRHFRHPSKKARKKTSEQRPFFKWISFWTSLPEQKSIKQKKLLLKRAQPIEKFGKGIKSVCKQLIRINGTWSAFPDHHVPQRLKHFFSTSAKRKNSISPIKRLIAFLGKATAFPNHKVPRDLIQWFEPKKKNQRKFRRTGQKKKRSGFIKKLWMNWLAFPENSPKHSLRPPPVQPLKTASPKKGLDKRDILFLKHRKHRLRRWKRSRHATTMPAKHTTVFIILAILLFQYFLPHNENMPIKIPNLKDGLFASKLWETTVNFASVATGHERNGPISAKPVATDAFESQNGGFVQTYFNPGHDWPSPCVLTPTIRHMSTEGVGYDKGYTTLDQMLFPFQSSKSFWPFVDFRAHAFDDGEFAANLGIGTRFYCSSWAKVIGFNTFFDYRETPKQSRFTQMGVGIEILGQCFDLRMNGYLPLRDRKMFCKCRWDYPGGYFIERREYEEAMPGVDLEIGAQLGCMSFSFTGCRSSTIEFYGAAGSYYFRKDCNKDIIGGKARFRIELNRRFFVEGIASHDQFFKTRAQVNFGITFPIGCCSKEKNWSRVLAQPVQRNDMIVIDNYCRWKWNYHDE